MAILSHALMTEVSARMTATHGLPVFFVDLGGHILFGNDPLDGLPGARARRRNHLQQGIGLGDVQTDIPVDGILTAMAPLEHNRVVLGGAGAVAVSVAAHPPAGKSVVAALRAAGMSAAHTERAFTDLVLIRDDEFAHLARDLFMTVYTVSGWQPRLLQSTRRRIEQQAQWSVSLEERRRAGEAALDVAEKERYLLALIRAGDRTEVRRILNEMLSAVFLSGSEAVLMRARMVELLSGLVRAAIEDNPLLEPLLRRFVAWAGELNAATDFEALSAETMRALDDFIDGVYLHGVNRTNVHVQRATEFIARHYSEPIGLDQVAAAAGISASRLAHVMKQHTGRTTGALIDEVRVRRAQELLDRSPLSCAEIGYTVGFSDQSYFSRRFRKLTGTSPGRYRRRDTLNANRRVQSESLLD